jgi:T5orf172 domain
MADIDEDQLLADLGLEVLPQKVSNRTPREERIIAGFEDILRFHQTHARAPTHGEGRDVFERMYAVRLEQLRKLPEARVLLADLDTVGLLGRAENSSVNVEALNEDELMTALGINAELAPADEDDITKLRHVRSYAEIKAAEELASRTPCADFDRFKPLFDEAKEGLTSGALITKPFPKNAGIEVGDFFILNGQVTYVAEALAEGTTKDGRDNPRLRVIFDNGTESDLLLRSLTRALYPDGDSPVGRRLAPREDGPLFGSAAGVGDVASGTIYIARSRSTHPFVEEHREVIHKIGVTIGSVSARVAAAENDPTYLMAKVDIVAQYALHNIDRVGLERVIQCVFKSAQLNLAIQDRFGKNVKPEEWFLVPLNVIDEAMQRIRDGSITSYIYDVKTARLVKS